MGLTDRWAQDLKRVKAKLELVQIATLVEKTAMVIRNMSQEEIRHEDYTIGRLGFEVEEEAALKHLRGASDSGYAYASGMLGEKHERGDLGLEVNLLEAARLYKIAKEGEPSASMAEYWTAALDSVNERIALQAYRFSAAAQQQ